MTIYLENNGVTITGKKASNKEYDQMASEYQTARLLGNYELYNVYGRYSDDKADALASIRRRYNDLFTSYILYIGSANGWYFSTITKAEINGKHYLIKETKTRTLIAEI